MVCVYHCSKLGYPPNWPQSHAKHFYIIAFLFPWFPAVFSWWSTVGLWNVSDLLEFRVSQARYANHLTVQVTGPSPHLSPASFPQGKWKKERSPVVYFRNNYLLDNPFLALRKQSVFIFKYMPYPFHLKILLCAELGWCKNAPQVDSCSCQDLG